MASFEELRKSGGLLYEYIRGSQAHGIATPQSDIDTGGVFILPKNSYIGLREGYIEEVASSKHDDVWYEFDKFGRLLLTSNPTILESLFIGKEFIKYVDPVFQKILDNRDKLVTKKCFAPFGGFAVSQIKKARGLNKKITIPMVERKTPLDFTYTFKNQGSQPILEWLQERGLRSEFCGLNKIPHMSDMYGLFYDWGGHVEKYPEDLSNQNLKTYIETTILDSCNSSDGDKFLENSKILHYRGLTTEEISHTTQLRLSSIDDKNDRPLCWISFNQEGFQKHCRDYKEYQEWVRNRNPVRYESNLEKSYDSKNMCECFRIMQMCIEIAKGKGVLVDRSEIDREFLLSVKSHKYEYQDLMKILDDKEKEMKEACESSKIPDEPDRDFINNLLLEVHEKKS